MKKIFFVMLSVFSICSFSKIALDIDFMNDDNGDVIEMKMKIETEIDKLKTFKIPKSNKIVEIQVSETIPDIMPSVGKTSDSLYIEMNVVEVKDNKRKVLASPQIVSFYGKEAGFEQYDDSERKNMIMSMKVLPTKL